MNLQFRWHNKHVFFPSISHNTKCYLWASLIAQLVKNPPVMQDTPVRFLGWEEPMQKGEANHSSILGLPLWLSWLRIRPQCGRPGFNPWVRKIPWRRERLPTPVIWPGELHGLYSRCARKESDTTEQLSLSHVIYSHGYSVLLSNYKSLQSCLSSKGKERKAFSNPLGFD